MQLVDSWRLFGPNLQTRGPAALAEVSFDDGDDVAAAVTVWRGELDRMASALGLRIADPAARLYRGGAVLTFSAPLDLLLPLTDLGEWAAASAASVVRGEGPLPLEPRRTELAHELGARSNPTLLALEAAAHERGLPFFWDDEHVTVGGGKHSRTWSVAALPTPAKVPWDEVAAIPLALVTGTNGKTTSVRLLARILKHAGHVVGMTTTDGVWIDEAQILTGDYTGPAGAAVVLRSTAIDAAVLETARGGILRRGVAVRDVGAALLTNVSDDHLGHYGIDDLATLSRVKAVVGSVVSPSGRVVVNAADVHLMRAASTFTAPLVLFAPPPGSSVVESHVARGGEAWVILEGFIVHLANGGARRVVATTDVPLGFGGAAPYNLANALGAAATAHALGVTYDAIAAGLAGFTSSFADNPGRGNLIDHDGIDVLIDFAHNPAGIESVLALARRLRRREGKLVIVAGYAGDRSDESVRDAAAVLAAARPDRVVLRDLRGYLRGRAPGEMPALFRMNLESLGLAPASIEVTASEAEGVRRALAVSRAGDLVVVLAHLESDEVRRVLAE